MNLCLIIILLGIFSMIVTQESFAESDKNIAPPNKQISNGTYPDSVNCKTELKLIFKHNFSPACVTSETFSKLLERGWMSHYKINVKIYTDKSEYKQGEEINIIMKNEGKEDVFFDFKIGFSIYDENENIVKSFGPGSIYLDLPKYDVKFSPYDNYNATWSQKDVRFKDVYVQPGTYTIKTDFLDKWERHYDIETKLDIIIPDEYHKLKKTADPVFIAYFDEANFVFVGKLTSKTEGISPDFFWLNFMVDEHLKYLPIDGKTSTLPKHFNITTHEGAWKNCILEEEKTYLVFVSDKYEKNYERTQNCFSAVEVPHPAIEELKEIASVLFD